jgi:hypothetical protein
MNKNSRLSLLAKFDKRWLGAGFAAAGAAVASDPASAAIVNNTSIPAANINVPSNFGGAYINVETGQTANATFTSFDINPYGATYLRMFTNGTLAPIAGAMKGAAAAQYSNLAPGTPICATDLDWRTGVLGTNSPGFPIVLNSSNNLFGMRFNGADNLSHVGWFRMSLSATSSSQPRTVTEWAWETVPGNCIGAGVTPEPTSLALLAAGAAGLVARRRRTA